MFLNGTIYHNDLIWNALKSKPSLCKKLQYVMYNMQSFLRSVQCKTKQTKSIEMIDVNALWNTNGHTVHLVEINET